MAAAVSGVVLLFAYGYAVDTSRAVPLAVGLALVVTGNAMGKLRPNWLVGIRTPWTLSSRQSWTKTHRQGGWLLVVVGLLLAAAGLVGAPALFAAAFGVLIAGCAWLLVYSYRVWRTDPERTTPAGTAPAPDAARFT